MLMPGVIVGGRFALERVGGAGGMGTVWRATDLRSSVPIAVKTFRPSEPRQVERFARETRILAQIEHPSVVRYVDHGMEKDGTCYLAMEWVEGERLSDRLARGSMSVRDSVEVAFGVANALGIVHDHGVIHRDIKPSNLMLLGGDPGRVVVIDFGIARGWAPGSGVTQSGILVGTPAYMSPEQARASHTLDARVDVFALGCVLYRCLTGRPPFAGDDAISTFLKVLLEDPPRARALCPAVPEGLDALVARMLDKSPDRRPADGHAVAADLAVWRGLEPTTGAPPRDVRPSASISAREVRVLSMVLTAPARSPAGGEDLAATGTLIFPPPEAVAEVVARCDCRADTLANGSIMVLPAEPGTATDLAWRAARAALELRRVLPPGIPIAVATGPGDLGASSPVGEVIDRAAALLREGRGDGVAVDELTLRLIGERFDVRRDERGAALLRERDALDARRLLLGRSTRFVGRERDIRALLDLLEECAEDASARVALMVAEAGAGKSRLCQELRARVEAERRARVLVGHADHLRSAVPYSLVSSALRRATDIHHDDDVAARRAKVLEHLSAHVSSADQLRVAEFLGELVGASFPDEARPQLRAARRDPILMGDQIRRALVDMLAAACAHQPVLLILEDLHWSDRPTVRFIDAALRALHDRRLMVVAFARPDVDATFPDLWSGRGMVRRELKPLGAAAAELLVRDALGNDLPTDTTRRILTRAAGNALYLEELIRAEAEGRSDLAPESVLAMVQTRLQALRPETRRLLRAASVFGPVFHEDGLTALLGDERDAAAIRPLLQELVSAEILDALDLDGQLRRGRFRFRHDLVREAAHAMLPEPDRAVGHALAARWLEARGGAEAAVIAEHFERGGEPRNAIRWLLRAADLAIEGGDFASVLACAERGLSAGAAGEERGELLACQAEAYGWLSQVEAMDACATEALALLREGSARWCEVLVHASVAAGRLGFRERAVVFAARLHGVLEAGNEGPPVLRAAAHIAHHLTISGFDGDATSLLDRIEGVIAAWGDREDDVVRARVLLARGQLALRMGEPGLARELNSAAAAKLEGVGDLRLACRARLSAAAGYKATGDNDQAERTFRAALDAAVQLNSAGSATDAMHNLTLLLTRRGAFDEAIALGQETAEAYARTRNRRMERATRIYLALALAGAGRLAEAERAARQATEPREGDPGLTGHALATLGRVLLSQGRTADALEAAEEAVRRIADARRLEEGEAFVRLVLGECRAAAGDEAGARAALQAAYATVMRQIVSIPDEGSRRLFLSNIPENARILALHEQYSV